MTETIGRTRRGNRHIARFRSLALTACVLLLLAGSAAAHELDENRATLVLRDGGHIAVSIYLSYPEVLHLEIGRAHV